LPLGRYSSYRQLDPATLIAELADAQRVDDDATDWSAAPLPDLIAYIQQRFHRPLEVELPRLSAMMDKVVHRHGDHLPATLLPLQQTFEGLKAELLAHMMKEDAILFPVIVKLASAQASSVQLPIEQPITVMEAEHASAGAALAQMSELTGGYTPPEWACPTFRGLYYGLAELEREMHVHVHLENNILFPRAAALAHA
jgi:regulator of cell morphogenesis and NO signaling